MVKMRLEPADDLMHEVEAASNFNESAYYNFFDPGEGVGGWLRMGNRVNEGYAEMTVCLYLPDGSVGFWFARPHIETNDAFDAGGLKFEVVEPFVEHRVTYEGDVVVLTNPADMEDPKAAFTSHEKIPCRVDTVHRGVGKVWGGEPVNDDGSRIQRDAEKEFARGHIEQHMAVTGTVTIGERSWQVRNGLGLRDHSWGPRYWQNIHWYRWFTANLGRDFGFAFTFSGDEQGRTGARGFLYEGEGGELVPIVRADVDTDYDDRFYHRNVTLKFASAAGKEYEVTGEVTSLIPLRNRRGDAMTRITEGMTRWHYGDLQGAGLSEYLDQIVDGRPVGVS